VPSAAVVVVAIGAAGGGASSDQSFTACPPIATSPSAAVNTPSVGHASRNTRPVCVWTGRSRNSTVGGSPPA
jgi:hypothetical protein